MGALAKGLTTSCARTVRPGQECGPTLWHIDGDYASNRAPFGAKARPLPRFAAWAMDRLAIDNLEAVSSSTAPPWRRLFRVADRRHGDIKIVWPRP